MTHANARTSHTTTKKKSCAPDMQVPPLFGPIRDETLINGAQPGVRVRVSVRVRVCVILLWNETS